MSDAREIIAKAAEEKLKFDGFSSYDEMAEHLIDTLASAGYRILGPDEVDPVTVERCAQVAERMLRFADTTSEADIAISEAIRALASGAGAITEP